MEPLKIYRRRLIPDECIHLKDDVVLLCNEEYIVTRWKTLKPRKDFSHGFSVYCLKEGIKVSKFYKPDGDLRYWYCDVVDYDINVEENTCTTTDLLVDVLVYPDGSSRIIVKLSKIAAWSSPTLFFMLDWMLLSCVLL